MRRHLKTYWRKGIGSNTVKGVIPIDNLNTVDINDICKFNGISVTKDKYQGLDRYTFGGSSGGGGIDKFRLGCLFNIVSVVRGSDERSIRSQKQFVNGNARGGWGFTDATTMEDNFYDLKNLSYINENTTCDGGRINWGIGVNPLGTQLIRTYYVYFINETVKNTMLILPDGTEKPMSYNKFNSGETKTIFFYENNSGTITSKYSPLYNGFSGSNELINIPNRDKAKVLWDNSSVVNDDDRITFDEVSEFHITFMGNMYNTPSPNVYKNGLASPSMLASKLTKIYPEINNSFK